MITQPSIESKKNALPPSVDTSWIDLRSDTVTKPSPELMLSVIHPDTIHSLYNGLGDDVFGEDRITTEFEKEMAALFGKEAALFVSSGTMANQLALKVHTTEGDEVILEAESHIFHYETAAAAFLSRVQLRTIQGHDGILFPDDLNVALRTKADWYPVPTLLCLENTHNRAGGRVYPFEILSALRAFCLEHRFKMHLDGARLWNAMTASGHSASEYGSLTDSLSVCFSKGLGAPMGSMLLGTAEFIALARRYRKMWGGGMRQTGIMVAFAKAAFERNFSRLAADHEGAKSLGDRFARHSFLRINTSHIESNIVSIDVSEIPGGESAVLEFFRARGILISSIKPGFIRLVTHHALMPESYRMVEAAIDAMTDLIA